MKKDKRINIRVTNQTFDRIKEDSKNLGLTITDYILKKLNLKESKKNDK